MDVTQAIPDELVELILLRLDATASLLRAASTCKQWRRVAADAVFLRRFRSLHPPTVAGSYYSSTKFAPSPSVSGAIDASHFSLGFLKHLYWCSWTIMDSRGGLLLLDRGFQRLIVCEPLTRRHMRIPPLAGFAAAAGHDLRAYLADGEEDETGARVSMSNFRVVHEFYRRGARAAVFNFTAGGRGAGGSRCSWKEMDIGHAVGSLSQMRLLGRAGGSCYLYSQDGRLVEFDGGTAEFSSSALPPAADENWDSNYRYLDLCFAEGRDGKPRFLSTCDYGRTLKVFARLDDGGSGGNGEWAVEKRIPMSEATREQLMGDEYEFEQSLLRQWLYMRQGIKNIFRYELPWPPVMRVGIGIGR